MEKIKNQVAEIVVFTGKSFEDIDQEYNEIGRRIDEGIERMKEAKVFSSSEIEEVRKYAINMINNRYDAAYSDIRGSIRSNFEF